MQQVLSLTEIVETNLRSLVAATARSHAIYRMVEYHMGWRDPQMIPVEGHAGKRTRGVLTLLCARAAGGTVRDAAPVAAAVELVHNLSLIYDDIQDEGCYRRGRPSVWNLWGSAQAINVGAALQALVCRALLPGYVRELDCLQEAIQLLCEGQHDDLALESGGIAPDVKAYFTMVGKKTGTLTGTAAYLGARSAKASERRAEHFRTFGHHLGVAYQLLDDVCGVWAGASGEKPAEDLARGKKSLPILLALDGAPCDLRASYLACPGAAGEALLARMEECRARERTIAMARVQARIAAGALREAEPGAEEEARLRMMLEGMFARSRESR